MQPLNLKRFVEFTAFGAAAILLAACGGGGASFGGGIGGSGSVHGRVAMGDTLVVNGVAFDDSEASVTINGEVATAADLRPGMIATVMGDVSFDRDRPGGAAMVEVETGIQAPIGEATVNEHGDTQLLIAEQTVIVNEDTNLDGLTRADLLPGRIVEASGYTIPGEEGSILALWVTGRDQAKEYVLRGEIHSLNEDALTFWIRKIRFDFSVAELLGEGTGGSQSLELLNGESIEVRVQPDLTLNPVKVVGVRRVDTSEIGFPGDVDVFTGVVSEVAGPDFTLQGASRSRRCRVTPSTNFTDGKQVHIKPGAIIRVQGVLDDDTRAEVDGLLFERHAR